MPRAQSEIRELAPVSVAVPRVASADADDVAIDALLRELYEVISFAEGEEPDWRRMAELFSPHARLTRVTPEGTDYLDVDGFQEFAKELIDLGTYTSFHESEVARTVRRFGAVAHVLSAYETKESAIAREPFARGVNSLQLIREAAGWRVLSLFWDEERTNNPLVLHDLFEGVSEHV